MQLSDFKWTLVESEQSNSRWSKIPKLRIFILDSFSFQVKLGASVWIPLLQHSTTKGTTTSTLATPKAFATMSCITCHASLQCHFLALWLVTSKSPISNQNVMYMLCNNATSLWFCTFLFSSTLLSCRIISHDTMNIIVKRTHFWISAQEIFGIFCWETAAHSCFNCTGQILIFDWMPSTNAFRQWKFALNLDCEFLRDVLDLGRKPDWAVVAVSSTSLPD